MWTQCDHGISNWLNKLLIVSLRGVHVYINDYMMPVCTLTRLKLKPTNPGTTPNIKKIQVWSMNVFLMRTQIFDAATPGWPLSAIPQETVAILIIFCSSASKGTTCSPGEQTEQLKRSLMNKMSHDNVYVNMTTHHTSEW